jgi:hypothetical protein
MALANKINRADRFANDSREEMVMDMWKTQSNPGKQTMLSVASAAGGLILMIGFRDFGGFGSNAMAGFLLGVLLLAIGIPGLLLSGRQTILIDPATRRITIEDSNRFRTKKRSIPFSDIAGISVGYLGKRSNFVTWYYLVLKLKNGEDYPLFAPGRFFEGASDKATVTSWKERLETYRVR